MFCTNYEIIKATFKWRQGMERHIVAVHEGKRPFQCENCDQKFHTITHFKRHFETDHPYNCKSCDKKFIRRTHLKNHFALVHNKINPEQRFSHQCKKCDNRYEIRRNLTRHAQRPHSYQCNLCEKSFIDKFQLRKHASLHGPITSKMLIEAGLFLKKEKYLSPSKPKEFQIKNEFASDCKIQVKKEILEGFNSVHEEKPYKCEACNATFTQRKSLNRHTAWVHQGKKPHKCDICQATFGQKSNLDSHIASSHDDLDKKPFKCETCPSAFDKRYKLKYHIDCVHEKKKPFSCKECYYSSAYKHDLKRHYESMHEGIRYKCDSCTSSFTEKSSLKTHVLFVHNGYRPFNCKFCEGTFSKKAYLERHQSAVHEGHRPFKCGFCEATFSAKQFLERHEDSVHKDKPDFYKVPIEPQRKGMKKEVPMNLDDEFKPFKCDSCEGTFSKKEFLERHRAAIHKSKDMRILSPKKATTELPRNNQGTQNESLSSSDESSDEEIELFKCDSCEGSFSKKENLEKHQATVHKGKQDSGNLGSDVPMELTKNTPRTQTELPTSSDESSDDNSDDEIKPFKCDSCEGTFSKKEFLERHQAAIHKVKQDSRNLNPKKSLELARNLRGNPKSSAETSNDLQSSQEGSKELPTTSVKPSKELSKNSV